MPQWCQHAMPQAHGWRREVFSWLRPDSSAHEIEVRLTPESRHPAGKIRIPVSTHFVLKMQRCERSAGSSLGCQRTDRFCAAIRKAGDGEIPDGDTTKSECRPFPLILPTRHVSADEPR